MAVFSTGDLVLYCLPQRERFFEKLRSRCNFRKLFLRYFQSNDAIFREKKKKETNIRRSSDLHFDVG